MRNIIKIAFVLLFSVLGYFVISNLQEMSSGMNPIPQQEQSDKKEIHSIDSPTILSDNLNRTLQSNVYSVKTKIAKTFYSNHFIKVISKKKENKSILVKKYFSFHYNLIGFKRIDVIFPFHYFW